MPSPFDRLQKLTFDTARDTFGFPAAYTSADGLVTWEGVVLFHDPTKALELAGLEVSGRKYTAEFFDGDLPGLIERVHARGSAEKITIDGQLYNVTSVDAWHDGKTHRANLVPVNP